MAIPDYADPRTHKHFSRVFIGSKHGDNGTSYRDIWSPDPTVISSTQCFTRDNRPVACAYCGNDPFLIQNEEYEVIGQNCVCKDAIDEMELTVEYKALLKSQASARQALKDKFPKPSKVVRDRIVDKVIEGIKKDLARDFFTDTALRQLEIGVTATLDKENWL